MPGSKPGERRGGRQKGALNKRTLALRPAEETLRRIGCDPVEIVGRIAMDETQKPVKCPHCGGEVHIPALDPRDRARIAASLLPYVAPQIARTEHTGEGGGPIAQEIIVTRLDRSDG